MDWGPVPGPKIPSNLLDLGRTTWSFFYHLIGLHICFALRFQIF
jgi:hypothetical protein